MSQRSEEVLYKNITSLFLITFCLFTVVCSKGCSDSTRKHWRWVYFIINVITF